MWWLKTTLVIAFVAFGGIMALRTWYWADNCVFNKIYVYPPVYQCGVHPLDFTDNYIDMRKYNQQMSEWVKARANMEDFPPLETD